VEGFNNKNIGDKSHIEGEGNKNYGTVNHIEGAWNQVGEENDYFANTVHNHVSGYYNKITSGTKNHVIGENNIIIQGNGTFVEGYRNINAGDYNHIEGVYNNILLPLIEIDSYTTAITEDGTEDIDTIVLKNISKDSFEIFYEGISCRCYDDLKTLIYE
jgi:hypothetical protein